MTRKAVRRKPYHTFVSTVAAHLKIAKEQETVRSLKRYSIARDQKNRDRKNRDKKNETETDKTETEKTETEKNGDIIGAYLGPPMSILDDSKYVTPGTMSFGAVVQVEVPQLKYRRWCDSHCDTVVAAPSFAQKCTSRAPDVHFGRFKVRGNWDYVLHGRSSHWSVPLEVLVGV